MSTNTQNKNLNLSLLEKNLNREQYSFANINLLGKCNADCFFCLGKDIPELLTQHNQINTYYTEWQNFETFLNQCKENKIEKLYITGQNVDSLQYRFLAELIDYLQNNNFTVGLRTNGYLAEQNIDTINKCKNSIGYSIHTLNAETNDAIMKRKDMPNWTKILKATTNPRVAIVINRYNLAEFWSLMLYLQDFDNIKYVQVRRVSTDTRKQQLMPDILAYEELYKTIRNQGYRPNRTFYGAECYQMFGLETVFWRTVQTSVNSMNYFTDGTISPEYFIVQGYLNNYEKRVY